MTLLAKRDGLAIWSCFTDMKSTGEWSALLSLGLGLTTHRFAPIRRLGGLALPEL